MYKIIVFFLILGCLSSCNDSSNNPALNTEANILAFQLLGGSQIGPANIDLDNKSVEVVVAYGTSLASLEASIDISSGASLWIKDTRVDGNVISHDFNQPLDLTIVAENGDTLTWIVKITMLSPSDEAQLISFSIEGQTEPALIKFDSHEIEVKMPYQADLTQLRTVFEVSEFAVVTIDEVIQKSGVTQNDFSEVVNYQITAQDEITTVNWKVFVEELPKPPYTVTTLVSDFPGNDGISVDSDGYIYVNSNGSINQWNGTSIYKVSPQGEFSLFSEGLPSWPVGSEIHEENLYVTGWNSPGKITKISLVDGTRSELFSGVLEASGLEIDDNGNIYVMEPPTNSMIKFESGGTKTVFASGGSFNKASGITFDDENRLFYVTNWNDGVISRVDMNGMISVFTVLPVNNLGPIINDADYLYITSYNSNKVFRVNKVSGESETIAGTGSSGHMDGLGSVATFTRPLGIGFSTDGTLLYISEISPTGNGRLRVLSPTE